MLSGRKVNPAVIGEATKVCVDVLTQLPVVAVRVIVYEPFVLYKCGGGLERVEVSALPLEGSPNVHKYEFAGGLVVFVKETLCGAIHEDAGFKVNPASGAGTTTIVKFEDCDWQLFPSITMRFTE